MKRVRHLQLGILISRTRVGWQVDGNRTSSSKIPLGTEASSTVKGTVAGGARARTTSKTAAANATSSVSVTSMFATLIEHNSKELFHDKTMLILVLL